MTGPTTPTDPLGGTLDLPTGATASDDVDILLSLEGIPGDSAHEAFPGALDLLSFGWSVQAGRPSAAGGGGGSGRPSAADVRIVTRASSASPLLLRHLATGRHVRRGAIHVLHPGEHPVEALTLSFTDVVVTGYEVAGSGGWPVDVVSFAMRSITETFVPREPDGSPGRPVSVTWDLRTTRVD